jgi:hypothetical protein
MPIGGMGASQFRGAVLQAGVYSASVTTPTVAANAVGFVAAAVTCPGVALGDVIMVAPTGAQTAGVSFSGQVTAANTVVITVSAGAAYTGVAAQGMTIVALRPKTA